MRFDRDDEFDVTDRACPCGCGERPDECPRGSWVRRLGRDAGVDLRKGR